MTRSLTSTEPAPHRCTPASLTVRLGETQLKDLSMSSSRHSSRRKNLDGRHRTPGWRKRHRVQLSFQSLETRWLMASFLVSNTNDNGGVNPAPLAGTGTLRQAIIDANANVGSD